MGKLSALLIGREPARADDEEDAADDGADEHEEGEDGAKTLDGPNELAALLMKGKGYASDGTCIHAGLDHPDMKDPSHPLQVGLRAFKRAHDAAMAQDRSSDRQSEQRMESRAPGRVGYDK